MRPRKADLIKGKVRTGKKVWGGGGGGERSREPCPRGGSCNLQLPLGGGSSYFIT